MRSQDRKVPAEGLILAIEDVLKRGPHSINQIARELGYSVSAVRWRLDLLRLEHRAYRRKVEFSDQTGTNYLWYHGAEVDIPLADVEPRENVPVQGTVREYPAIDRRDPLVVALFGRARQVVKRGR